MLQRVVAATGRQGATVARALAVLRTRGRPGPDGNLLTATAEHAKLPAPPVHRYLRALVREGAVEQRGPRARCVLHRSPSSLEYAKSVMFNQSSPTVTPESIKLQSRTGQIAIAYRPHLIRSPMRISVEQAIGANGKEVLNAAPAALPSLPAAPLETDVAGLVCLGTPSLVLTDLSLIRQDGHAVGTASLHDRCLRLVRLGRRRGSGTAALQEPDATDDFASPVRTAVMGTAVMMSGQLPRSEPRRTS
ncbi:helix-turn-helix domain-containing protein [Streptomyces mirabilis]|uniref:helix-turn-helix domain-containing protein n=1 Tax=Streptomyces mirabilis TaxID=68239 RepID=UPI0036865489